MKPIEVDSSIKIPVRCWFLHQWARWVPYKQHVMESWMGMTKPVEGVVNRQRRECIRCGKVQDELIF